MPHGDRSHGVRGQKARRKGAKGQGMSLDEYRGIWKLTEWQPEGTAKKYPHDHGLRQEDLGRVTLRIGPFW